MSRSRIAVCHDLSRSRIEDRAVARCTIEDAIEDRGVAIEDRGVVIEDRGVTIEDRGSREQLQATKILSLLELSPYRT